MVSLTPPEKLRYDGIVSGKFTFLRRLYVYGSCKAQFNFVNYTICFRVNRKTGKPEVDEAANSNFSV